MPDPKFSSMDLESLFSVYLVSLCNILTCKLCHRQHQRLNCQAISVWKCLTCGYKIFLKFSNSSFVGNLEIGKSKKALRLKHKLLDYKNKKDKAFFKDDSDSSWSRTNFKCANNSWYVVASYPKFNNCCLSLCSQKYRTLYLSPFKVLKKAINLEPRLLRN